MIPRSPSSEAIEQAAAAWAIRRDRGLTAAEQDEFLDWLAADPRHSAAHARHQRNFARLDQLALWRPENSPLPNPDLLAPPVTPWFKRHFVPLALAASVALAAALWQAWLRPAPASTPTAPVLLAAIEKRVLEDGSVVELNRGAQVSVLYTPDRRLIRLERGEAHFVVAKNPDRPFIVTVSGVAVRAVGTAFNVKLDAGAVKVVVTEGKVGVTDAAQGRSLLRVTGENQEAVLAEGQRAVVSLASPVPAEVETLSPAEAEAELAWQPRLLDFTDMPLKQIVAEFNRRNPVRLVIADPEVAEIAITASFRSDNLDGFVRLLEVGFHVQTAHAGDTITLRSRPADRR